ncbi:MAG: folylpolyglutamate synthase/dihydrofolate synthase family protein [Oscillospiraceae bacterium]
MTYEEAMTFIHDINWRKSKLGLERISELLHLLGDPQDELSVIHVAGTNGKGSVCAMLSYILKEAGYKTGLYISPYITDFNERMQIDNVPIGESELCELTESVRAAVVKMDCAPTEFEIVCAIAFLYFRNNDCDIVVLEVGMGGRLDATNVVKAPLVSVLTAIDYDHMQYLGDTLEAIAGEKAGIIKEGCPAVSYEQPKGVLDVFRKKCGEEESLFSVCDFSKLCEKSSDINGQTFDYKEYKSMFLPLLGEHQQRNAALVLETVKVLKERNMIVSEDAVRKGLAAVTWPARFEVLCREPMFVLDGGHNPHGVRCAVAAVKRYFAKERVIVLVGVLADKNYEEMLELFDDVAGEYVAVTVPNPRALPAAELAKALEKYGRPVKAFDDVAKAVDFCLDLAKEKNCPVLAAGSLYMSGEIREKLLRLSN